MSKRITILIAAIAVLAAAAAPVVAQQPTLTGNVETGGGEQLTIKGFISASFYMSDANWAFGNGQPAQFPLPPELDEDEWNLDGDVRNTRLTMVFNGPEVAEELRLGGVLELDFFGGFNGSGAFSDEQPQPRLRLAYLDIHKGRTTFRLGQAWSPLFGNVPVSLSHVAFPLGYGSAGFVGWRFPGLFVYHPLSDADDPIQSKLSVGIMRGSWDGPGSNLSGYSAGNASLMPQVEARLDFSGSNDMGAWSTYVVGHYDRKDLSGVGVDAPDDELDGYAAEVGAKLSSGPVLIHGNAYWGDSIGQQFGHITQFGDITGWGAWLQLGYDFTDRWTGYVFAGYDDPDDEDVIAARGDAARLENTAWALSLLYDVGPYGLNLEWFQADTDYRAAGGVTGNQLVASAIYRF